MYYAVNLNTPLETRTNYIVRPISPPSQEAAIVVTVPLGSSARGEASDKAAQLILAWVEIKAPPPTGHTGVLNPVC